MNVFRIERVTGVGAFISRLHDDALAYVYDREQMLDQNHSAFDMPTPYDGKEKGTALYKEAETVGFGEKKFAFQSLELLSKVFRCPVGRKAMQESGGRLAVYKVKPSHVVHGNWQCVFVPKGAKMIQVLDLETFEEIPCESAQDVQ